MKLAAATSTSFITLSGAARTEKTDRTLALERKKTKRKKKGGHARGSSGCNGHYLPAPATHHCRAHSLPVTGSARLQCRTRQHPLISTRSGTNPSNSLSLLLPRSVLQRNIRRNESFHELLHFVSRSTPHSYSTHNWLVSRLLRSWGRRGRWPPRRGRRSSRSLQLPTRRSCRTTSATTASTPSSSTSPSTSPTRSEQQRSACSRRRNRWSPRGSSSRSPSPRSTSTRSTIASSAAAGGGALRPPRRSSSSSVPRPSPTLPLGPPAQPRPPAVLLLRSPPGHSTLPMTEVTTTPRGAYAGRRPCGPVTWPPPS